MPRKPREKSRFGIYHVILRGVNKQIIFEENEDYLQFIRILKKYKEVCEFKLYAYCLMDNHVHLLMEQTTTDLGTIMKRIEVKFVKWYNRKYKRIGYLFQDRYKSEPINDEGYFRTVFRYIHQNPLHAGLETAVGTYRWSSYYDYAISQSSFVDIDKAINFFQSNEKCIEYLQYISDEKCMEYNSLSRLSDTEALKIIHKKTSCKSASDFQHLDRTLRNQHLQKLHYSGISIRQLSRLTGISRTAINNAIREKARP